LSLKEVEIIRINLDYNGFAAKDIVSATKYLLKKTSLKELYLSLRNCSLNASLFLKLL
jgi:hypothetical protein